MKPKALQLARKARAEAETCGNLVEANSQRALAYLNDCVVGERNAIETKRRAANRIQSFMTRPGQLQLQALVDFMTFDSWYMTNPDP